MAKILYGLCGEGLGHASRSRILINYLKKKHDIRIVAGGKAFSYMSKEFDSVYEIESPLRLEPIYEITTTDNTISIDTTDGTMTSTVQIDTSGIINIVAIAIDEFCPMERDVTDRQEGFTNHYTKNYCKYHLACNDRSKCISKLED